MDVATAIPLADTWGMHGDDVGAGWMIVMMVVMVLFWAAVILGIVWLVRGSAGGWPGWRRETPTEGQRRETPTEVLERRFAEGAISAEEYRARRDVLANGGEPARRHTAAPAEA